MTSSELKVLFFNIIHMAVLAAAVFLAVSCSDRSGEARYVIGYSQCVTDPWRVVALNEMQIEVSNYPDTKLLVMQANGSSPRQVAQIREMIAMGVDVLVISPNEAEAVTDIAVEAYRKGIPAIIHDRRILSDEYTVSIGADNYSIGRSIGQFVSTMLPPGSSILEIWGLEGSSPAQDRHNGFTDGLDPGKRYKIHEIRSDWHYGGVQQQLEGWGGELRFDLVFAHNDIMAIAAHLYFKKNFPDRYRQMKFVGIDGVYGHDAGMQAVADGILDASFIYPTGGALTIQVARNIIDGVPVAKDYLLETGVIDSSNAATLLSLSAQMFEHQDRIYRQRSELAQLTNDYIYLRSSTLYISILLCLLVPLLLYVLIMNLRVRKKNRKLAAQKLLIERQKEELGQKNDLLQAATDYKLRFFTNISHELRTPISLISNPLEKISRMTPDEAVQAELTMVNRNVARLKRIIDQILDFRKIENEKMVPVLMPVDISQLAGQVYGYFEIAARDKGIDYRLQCEEDTYTADVDRDMIEKVMVNLLSNAFKHTPAHGKISLKLVSDQENVMFMVTDDGIGIAPGDLPFIFDCFYTARGEAGGTGIGLHLSKEYVLLRGGDIAVESQPGEFTRFTVTLRKHSTDSLYDRAAAVGEEDSPQRDGKLSMRYPIKVLLVEDDTDSREYLARELAENFTVYKASDGRQALALLEKQDGIEVVLSDVMMPELSGYELCRIIKDDVRFSHISVYLITALAQEGQILTGLGQGADGYIKKPFVTDIVRMTVINDYERRQAARKSVRDVKDVSDYERITTTDDRFRGRIMEIMAENYSDPEFTVETLAGLLEISRIHLYRKMKSIYDLTPTDLIRNYRLARARQLLDTTDRTVSEVAYDSGFTSPSYFIKCYRLYYGITPKQQKSGKQE